MNRTMSEIVEEITTLKKEVCLKQPHAHINTNAPLAITQIETLAKLNALEWVMKRRFTRLPKRKIP